MINEPPHIQFSNKTWDVKQSPVNPTELLLTIVLTATTSLSSSEVEVIKDRILKEGIRAYVTGTIDTDMITAMRGALLRAEHERDQNRTRADHFEAELTRSNERLAVVEADLAKKKRTLGFLAEGLR